MLRRGANVLVLAVTLAATSPAAASEIVFSHAAIARALHAAAMTSGGRWFLQGQSDADCAYGFLQDPRVAAEGGRLRITLLFSGRGAVRVRDRCVGPGDTFDVVLSGVPSFSGGELVLADPQLTAPNRAYFQVVRPLIERALQEKLHYPVRNAVEWAVHDLRERTGQYVSLSAFDVEGIAVEPAGVRLKLRFGLDVR